MQSDELDDGPLDVMDGVPAADKLPDTAILRSLRAMATDLVETNDEIDRLEEQVKVLKEKKYRLETRELPELFDQCQTDSMGVPDLRADVKMDTRYHANIKADWPEELRAAGFRALEELGGGNIIRVSLQINFTRGELDKARAVIKHLREWNEFQNRPIEVTQNVPWNTLTSFVKEQHQRGKIIPMEALGATVGRFAKIFGRKK